MFQGPSDKWVKDQVSNSEKKIIQDTEYRFITYFFVKLINLLTFFVEARLFAISLLNSDPLYKLFFFNIIKNLYYYFTSKS